MTVPATSDQDSRAQVTRQVRILLGIGMVAGCCSVFGHVVGTRTGGFGPAMFWLGLVVAALAFGLGMSLHLLFQRLARTRPGFVLDLSPLFAAGMTTLQVAILTLIAFEVVSRYTHPRPARQWEATDNFMGPHRPDAMLGWVPAKNYEATVALSGGPHTLAVNAAGCRDIEQRFDPDAPHVVIIGDSYAIGWGGNYDDGITPRLRADLPGVQVYNVGWAGWSKDQIALSYTSRARQYEPDVVVVMFMVDPGRDDSLPLYGGLRKPWFVLDDDKLVLEGLPLDFQATPEKNKALYRKWEAERITGPVTAARFLTRGFPREYLALGKRFFPDYDWDVVNRDGLPPLSPLESAILIDLKKSIEADGVKMVVAVAPRPIILRMCKDPVKAMRSYLDSYRSIGIDPIDITRFVGRDWQRYYNQESHPNGDGVKLIRGELARQVRAGLGEGR